MRTITGKQVTSFAFLLIIFQFLMPLAMAHAGHEHTPLEQGEAIVNAQIPCEDITEDQLDAVGQYLLYRAGQGTMDNTLNETDGAMRTLHITVAENNYCGNTSMISFVVLVLAFAGIVVGVSFWISRKASKKKGKKNRRG